jgi:hypothetical protein
MFQRIDPQQNGTNQRVAQRRIAKGEKANHLFAERRFGHVTDPHSLRVRRERSRKQAND